MSRHIPTSEANFEYPVVSEISVAAAETRIAELERELSSLRSREQEFTDFAENGSIGLHRVGADGTILWANQAELDLLGYQKSEYFGHHISEFHADSLVIEDILQRLQAKEILRDYSARLRCKDGSIRWVLINSNVLWEGERFLHTRCFTRDVTDHKRVDEELEGAYRNMESLVNELRAREELFRMALGKSPVVVFHQNAELRYTWLYNPFPQHESISLVNKLDSDLFQADQAEHLTQLKQAVLSSGIGFRQEVSLSREGQLRVMDLTVEPFRNSFGELVGILGTAVDVTDRKLNEEHFRNSRQQLRSLAARMQAMREEERALTSREVHDLSQMLTALELRLAIVADTLPGPEHGGAVAERLRGISELLVSTIESSARISTELRPSLLDTLGLAAAIDWQTRELQSRTGIRVIVDIPERVLIDPMIAISVFRTFQEILTSVERHAHATELRVSLRNEERGVILEVRDNGSGIPVDGIVDPKSLGLLELRELALLFGGILDIQRDPANGTAVSLAFPRTKRAIT